MDNFRIDVTAEGRASFGAAMGLAAYWTADEVASAPSLTAGVKRPYQGMSAAASRRVARPEAGS